MVASSGSEVLWDIQLEPWAPGPLRSEFPGMQVSTAGPRTVLRLGSGDPEDLSALLEKLRSVGIVPDGLTRCREPDPLLGTRPTYEVWVGYELGAPLLAYLKCEHHFIPSQTQVRLRLGVTRLARFVRACARCGARIDHVRRVEPSGTAPMGRGGPAVSTGQAAGPDAPRRRDG
jgi:hypothetical protein